MDEGRKESSMVLSSTTEGLGIVTLNHPLKRNALSQDMIEELLAVLSVLSRDRLVRVIVLTSVGESPFCAGADLNELAALSTAAAFQNGWLNDLEMAFANLRKPIVAAVRGFALGGGFELCLMCDVIIAASNACFGLPEVKLSTIPGAGGTQRLTRSVGKHKAMELVLTGASISAVELERLGAVNKTCAEEEVFKEACNMAQSIARFSAPAIGLAKQAVKAAESTTLQGGLELEKALYYSSFSLTDCNEGVRAFLEKRAPIWHDV